MSARAIIATLFIMAGFVVMILVATADILEIGLYPRFGQLQEVGVIAAAVGIITGAILLPKKSKPAANG